MTRARKTWVKRHGGTPIRIARKYPIVLRLRAPIGAIILDAIHADETRHWNCLDLRRGDLLISVGVRQSMNCCDGVLPRDTLGLNRAMEVALREKPYGV